MRISDWSSDVCSSDLERERQRGEGEYPRQHAAARPCPDAGIGLAHLTRITGHVVPLLPERHVSDPARWIAACRTAGRMPQTVDPRSEEHTSELQSLMRISYAVFCLKKKNHIIQ